MNNTLKISFAVLCTLSILMANHRLAPSEPPLKTANDYIKPYTGNFRYGSNMGYYPPYTDAQLADWAAKAGVNSLRPAFFEFFGEQWGYDIRLDAFAHYGKLGMTENVCFVGYPSTAHRDNTVYCGKDSSALFANMYAPIWDNGENGTPVNDKNYYALYLYKVVTRYGKNVKFWEVWNEPDFATTFKTEMAPGLPGAWWNTNPDPCEYALHAPVQHYIRLLRISYEVIKKLDPSAYVCVGGIGFPSFLDVILRQTDNPQNGQVTPQYPLKGGAYFDVLSYHSYPHIDGSVRSWSDKINGFAYSRHSDRATEGVFSRQRALAEVLKKYGYDGTKYPSKLWILTECNIPSKAVGEFMGSPEAQRNFTIKSLVKAQAHGLLQYHIYSLAELSHEKEARNEFDLMGLFKKLENTPAQNVEMTEAGIAFRTTSQLLYGYRYDAAATLSLQLPPSVDGAVFKHPTATDTIFCLWAKTTTDRSETASANVILPIDYKKYDRMEWDFLISKKKEGLVSNTIALKGTPCFIVFKKR